MSQPIGDLLTSPSFSGEDANPDIALEHRENPDLSVWIAHFNTPQGEMYALSCWGLEHQMHFEVPRETAQDVVRRGIDSHNWLLGVDDEDIIDSVINNL